MKQLLYITFLLLPFVAFSQDKAAKIQWVTIEEAQELVKKKPKKILVDVYTKWCGPCKMMMRNTFTNPTIIDYINKHYYAVKFNAEGNDTVTFKGHTFTNPKYDPAKAHTRNATHQFTQAIAAVNGRIAYPTLLWLDEDLNLLTPVQGYLKPPQIEPILNWFGSNTYLTVKYDEYVKTFKSALPTTGSNP